MAIDEQLKIRIFIEVFTVVAFLGVAANCVLIFVIIKYKKLRQDATSFIFLHVNILQAVYLICLALTVRGLTSNLTHLCGIHEVEISVGLAITGLLFILICDSYLKIYYKDKYTKFCRIYKFLIICNYVIYVCACAITVPQCSKLDQVANSVPMEIFWIYPVLLAVVLNFVVFLIIINIIHAIRKKRLTNYNSSNIGLVTTNIFFLMWIPAVIATIMSLIRVKFATGLVVTTMIGFMSPIINLIYVYKYDNVYHIFLKKIFTCKCKEYENDELEEQPVPYNETTGALIS